MSNFTGVDALLRFLQVATRLLVQSIMVSHYCPMIYQTNCRSRLMIGQCVPKLAVLAGRESSCNAAPSTGPSAVLSTPSGVLHPSFALVAGKLAVLALLDRGLSCLKAWSLCSSTRSILAHATHTLQEFSVVLRSSLEGSITHRQCGDLTCGGFKPVLDGKMS